MPTESLKSSKHSAFVIALAGPTCTGKTSVATRIARRVGGQTISLESYYLDQADVPISERVNRNYDSPESIDASLLIQQVKALAAGQDVEVPIYDFAEHTRTVGRTQLVKAGPVLIVEGILVLHWPELRALYDKSFYLDAPSDVSLQRRRVRDIVERQRSHEFIVQQYNDKVLPMAELYVHPTKRYANVVIDARQSIDSIEAEVMSHLSRAAAAR